MVAFTKQFSAAALAVGVALGSTGCSTTMTRYEPVNNASNTNHVQANANQNVPISRCEDNGILVVDANPYNFQQFQRQNPWIYDRNSGITSEMVNTASGPKLLYYANPVTSGNSGLGGLAGAGIGGVAGAGIGQGKGSIAATIILGSIGAVVGSVIENNISMNFKKVSAREIAECRFDTISINGGPATQRRVVPNSGYWNPNSPY